jgi:hypothetical protein
VQSGFVLGLMVGTCQLNMSITASTFVNLKFCGFRCSAPGRIYDLEHEKLHIE